MNEVMFHAMKESDQAVEVERTLRLLEEIEKAAGSRLTQPLLSKRVGMAVGLVNLYIRRLIRKGYVKTATLPRNRVKYLLTPHGIAEKTRLTYEYALYSYRLYRTVRQRCREVISQLAKEGCQEIALYGTGDAAEIACLTLQEHGLKLVGVVDGKGGSKRFLGFSVVGPEGLRQIGYDRLLVASLRSRTEVVKELQEAGVPMERVCWLEVV